MYYYLFVVIGQDYTKVLTNLFNYPKGAAPVSLVLNIAVSSMYSSLDRPFFEDPSLGAPFPRTIPPLDIYTQQSPARTPKRPVTPTPVNSSSNANTNVLEYSDNTSVGYSPSSSPSPQSRIKKRGPKDKLHEMVMARHQQKQQPNGSGGATPTQRYVELWERVTDLESVQEEVRNHVDQIIQDIAALCGSGNSSRKSSTSNGINGSVDEDNDDDDEEEEDEEKDEFYYADNGSLTQVLTDLHDIKYTLTCAQINE